MGRGAAFFLAALMCSALGTSPLFADTIVLTSGTSWTVPANWNSTNNSIEVIGAGGNGSAGGTSAGTSGAGGGGGAYAKTLNLSLTPSSSVAIQIGAGGGDTWFKNTATILAKAGANASG